MRRALALAAIVLGTSAAEAARIDEGPVPDFGRFLKGCWVSAEGTLATEIAAAGAKQVELCFTEGSIGTALLDAAGARLGDAPGSYAFRSDQIVLTSDAGWIFGRATLICDIGVKPYVRLGLFDCVGSGAGHPVRFFDDMLLWRSRVTRHK